MDFQLGLMLGKDFFYTTCDEKRTETWTEKCQWELDREQRGIASAKDSHKQIDQTAPAFWPP